MDWNIWDKALEHINLCDPGRGRCVECTSSEDCDEQAFGPSCQSEQGYCICASDADCRDNGNGPLCIGVVSACGCHFDSDCPAPTTCTLEPYLGAGIRTCK